MPPNSVLPTSIVDTATATAAAATSNEIDSSSFHNEDIDKDHPRRMFRCAILGSGMMGQEHLSYLEGYPSDVRIDFLCDPHEPSLRKSFQVMEEFQQSSQSILLHCPELLDAEEDLLVHAHNIDLLVIASPNYLHAETLVRWAKYDLTILVEKPVAVSKEQHDLLVDLFYNSRRPDTKARIWVAMEYRFIPAIAKLITLLPTIGDLKMITIRENRYPFLHKIDAWNRDKDKTGDTLVEKCCHFFDLFRLLTGQEVNLSHVRALAQRGLNYQDEESTNIRGQDNEQPIIDSAYVIMPFLERDEDRQHHNVCTISNNADNSKVTETIGCLELCMYAEGSRHQEEIVVTGTRGRLEAYLPENKVYSFVRPSTKEWSDRSVPPPINSIQQRIYDCSNIKEIHGIEDHKDIPTHGGYHYSSTTVEWYHLLQAMKQYEETGLWHPQVSLEDGLRAVEIGLQATEAIVGDN